MKSKLSLLHKHWLIDLLILSFAFGILVTLLKHYDFVIGDQLEQLPLIFRQMNPRYLVNDFFTNVTASFGPRFYYSKLFSLLATPSTLPYIMFILTILTNTAICFISGFISFKLFNSRIAGLLAACLVTVADFDLVTPAARLQQNVMLPSFLVLPFLLLSVWLGLKGHIIRSTLVVLFSSLIHPTLGLGTGSLILIIYTLYELIYKVFIKKEKKARNVFSTLFSFSIFGLISYIFWIKPTSTLQNIPISEFYYIFAQIRSPEHLLPKTWPVSSFIQLLVLVLSVCCIWLYMKRKRMASNDYLNVLALYALIILLGCLFVYFIGDTFFIRLWATFQPFRFLYLVKWIGMILISGLLSSVVKKETKLSFVIFVSIFFMLQPFMSVFILPVVLSYKGINIRKNLILFVIKILFLSCLIILELFLNVKYPPVSSLFNYYLYFLLAAILFMFSVRHAFYSYLLSLFIAFFTLIVFVFQRTLPFPTKINNFIKVMKPVITYAEHKEEESLLAKYAREKTPKEAIFLTPFEFGKFRVLAQRAIVFNFSSVPFQDVGMKEWYERLVAIYQRCDESEWIRKLNCFNNNYQNLSEQKILQLHSLYGFSYAIFYKKTKTNFPITFTSENFQIVKINDTDK